MSLTELWKKSRDQFENKQVHQIIAFAGEGKLRDGSIAASEFREFLSHISSEVLCQYSENCLNSTFNDSGLALQDIINQVGRRLGFEVEDGRYQGSKNSIGNDGLWCFPSGHHVVIEVKTTDAYRIDSNKIAEYRRKLIASQKITEEKSSILIIVGREDTGDLEAQIRGSRHAWDIRLISVDSLLRLMLLKEKVDDPQIIQRICDILIPKEFTRLDNIVDIAFFTAEEAKQETGELENVPELLENFSDTQPLKRVDKPVAFNEACVEKFSVLHDINLIRQTKTKYLSTDKKIRVVCLVSKDYEKLKDNAKSDAGSYWYGFHTHQKQFLEEAENGYLLLGCGSPNSILAIKSDEVNNWLDEFNITAKDSDLYWHLQIFLENGKYLLERKQGKGRFDITKYKI
jgi:hypothetical protein